MTAGDFVEEDEHGTIGVVGVLRCRLEVRKALPISVVEGFEMPHNHHLGIVRHRDFQLGNVLPGIK